MITKALIWGIIVVGAAILFFVWTILQARKECRKGWKKK